MKPLEVGDLMEARCAGQTASGGGTGRAPPTRVSPGVLFGRVLHHRLAEGIHVGRHLPLAAWPGLLRALGRLLPAQRRRRCRRLRPARSASARLRPTSQTAAAGPAAGPGRQRRGGGVRPGGVPGRRPGSREPCFLRSPPPPLRRAVGKAPSGLLTTALPAPLGAGGGSSRPSWA